MSDAFNKLIALNKKRRNIRDKAKHKYLSSTAKNDPSSELTIKVPKMHISRTNHQLRIMKTWLYNGFLIKLGELNMLVDPGLDILYRLSISGEQITNINTLFISHGHIDHTDGANSVMDWLVSKESLTEIVTSKSVLDEKEISQFHAGLQNEKLGWNPKHFTTVISDNSKINLANGGFKLEAIPMQHGVECFGFVLYLPNGKKLGYISDTGYAREVKEGDVIHEVGKEEFVHENLKITKKFEVIRNAYIDVDYLIVNVETFEYSKKSKSHLTIFDVIDLVQDSSTSDLFLVHVNPMGELGEEWPEALKDFVVEKVPGLRVHYPTAKNGIDFKVSI